ncbi:GIY-YIG nuclease family protein [Hymenobacter aerophilus]|uniref:GIY-YIG nuclease family protein n=1 Tax=Hymenobacter aerophilus TaxID=119644 RepID=UPI000365AFF3|nr:GIY-YIG nuclease family protein [Hymenobacter aerophilus]
MNAGYYVYITANPTKTALYTGLTNDLHTRLRQHFENRGTKSTFAGRYSCYQLLYFEHFQDVNQAIAREKEIKGWTREKKNMLITQLNPHWQPIDPTAWQDGAQ